MLNVVDFLYNQSDVEFLETVRSRIDYLTGHHRSRRIHALQLRIPPEIELTRIDKQGPNLVERCRDILNWTNAQRVHTPQCILNPQQLSTSPAEPSQRVTHFDKSWLVGLPDKWFIRIWDCGEIARKGKVRRRRAQLHSASSLRGSG